MNKKGFTLIELLAVIVILSIIALIATPLILGAIDNAKKGAFKSSVYGIIDSIEQGYTLKSLNNETPIETVYKYNNKIETREIGNIDINYKGSRPENGTLVINIDGKIALAFYQDNICITKSYYDSEITSTKTTKELCTIKTSLVYNSEKGVNAPQLSEGMTPIKWDSNNNEITTTEYDSNWYDYANKKWANVKTKDGSYFVWIPRYAYKITSGYHSSTTGSIDVKFLKGTSDIVVDGTSIKTSGYIAGTNDTSMYYFTHPTFQNDINQTGFWVAKYEPTAAEGVANGFVSDRSCPVVGDNVSIKTIKIVPSVDSWRCMSIVNAYTASIAMKTNSIYGWNKDKVDSHMATNLEWGAIYYLTLSKYGANTNEVYINNNQNYITGCAGDTASSEISTATICKNPYDSVIGVKASTTWNITGVYDMSGGSWERTMSVYNNLLASSGFTTESINKLPSSHITKYTTANLLNNVGMDYDATVYGDGIYETSSGAGRYNGTAWIGIGGGGWSTECSYLPYTFVPWFLRGTNFYSTSVAGLSGISGADGGPRSNNSFRPIVSIIN